MHAAGAIAGLSLAAAALVAQEAPPAAAPDIEALRRAFAAFEPDACAFAVAIVAGQEPIVLCQGLDTRGEPATPNTLVPVGSLARLLVADAVHVAMSGALDRPAGVALGGREPTVRDLLRTEPSEPNLVPDHWDWRPDAVAVPEATLLACADFAAGARISYSWSCAGMAELTLLSRRALGVHTDWESMLRVTLSPHVGGLAPRTAGRLDDAGGTPTSVASDVAANAEPAVLRLLLSPRDLGSWWRWRLDASLPLWDGLRMGNRGEAPRHAGVDRWYFEDFGVRPVKALAVAYPERRAGLLCVAVGPTKWTPGRDEALAAAFETDVLGEPTIGPGLRLGGRVAGTRRKPLRGLVGRTWTGKQGTTACSVEVVDAGEGGLRFTFAGATYVSAQVTPVGKAMRVVTSADGDRSGVLWIRLPEADDAEQGATAVFVARDERSTVPHLLELTPGRDR